MRFSQNDLEDQKQLLAHALGLRAEVEAEEFDRTLPGGRLRGTDEWVPFLGEPMLKSNAHGKHLRRVAERAAHILELGTVPRGSEIRLSFTAMKSELELFRQQSWWPSLDVAWKCALGELGAAASPKPDDRWTKGR